MTLFCPVGVILTLKGHDQGDFVIVTTVCSSRNKCNTSQSTNCDVWNSFRILFGLFGVILTLKCHRHGHLFNATTLFAT